MSWEGMDRRKFPRVMYPCMIKVLSADGAQLPLLTHTENIGQGGLCFILKQEIRLFTPVELEVDLLDSNEHIKAKGKVVWIVRRKSIEKVKPMFYDIGVEFTDLAKHDRAYLADVLQRLVAKGTPLSKPYI